MDNIEKINNYTIDQLEQVRKDYKKLDNNNDSLKSTNAWLIGMLIVAIIIIIILTVSQKTQGVPIEDVSQIAVNICKELRP